MIDKIVFQFIMERNPCAYSETVSNKIFIIPNPIVFTIQPMQHQ